MKASEAMVIQWTKYGLRAMDDPKYFLFILQERAAISHVTDSAREHVDGTAWIALPPVSEEEERFKNAKEIK